VIYFLLRTQNKFAIVAEFHTSVEVHSTRTGRCVQVRTVVNAWYFVLGFEIVKSARGNDELTVSELRRDLEAFLMDITER
jgi:hypothetical protein